MEKLPKNVFQVAVINKHGYLISNRTMSSEKMAILVAQHPQANIYMEVCGSAHY